MCVCVWTPLFGNCSIATGASHHRAYNRLRMQGYIKFEVNDCERQNRCVSHNLFNFEWYSISRIFSMLPSNPLIDRRKTFVHFALYSLMITFFCIEPPIFIFIFFFSCFSFILIKVMVPTKSVKKTIKLHRLSERNIQCFMDPPFDLQPIECTISITSSVSK